MGENISIEGVNVPVGSHKGKTIIIGSDHRGFSYKSKIIKIFKEKNYCYIDVGTDSAQRCDYPAISDNIGKLVAEDVNNRVGIGLCGSGIGILIPASKHPKIYAARCSTPEEAETSRKHNNTNVLGIGADYVDLETTLRIIDKWLTTPFYSDPSTEEAYLKRYIQTVKLENRTNSS